MFLATVRILVSRRREGSRIVHLDEFGTAFIVERRLSRFENVYLLVTAAHVIKDAVEGSLFFLRDEPEAKPLSLSPYEFHASQSFQEMWFLNSSPAIDVAVTPLDPFGPIFDDLKSRNIHLHGLPISEATALTRSALRDFHSPLHQLDALEEVIFVGYPTGHFDRTNSLPIVRRGFAASWMQVPFEGQPMFLIDAAVWPGSSGSPVFCLHERVVLRQDAETPLESVGRIMTDETLFFLGMLTDVWPSKLDRQTNINLGAVLTADAIFDTADQFLATRQTRS